MANENNNVVAGLNIELGATANKAQINGEINKVLTALDAIGKHQSKVKIDASDLSKLNKIINDITSKIGSNNTITSRVKNNLTAKLREGFEGAMPQMRKVVHDNIRSLTAEMEKAISQMQRGKFVNTAQLKITKDKVSNLSNLYETLGLSGVNNSKALQGLQNTFRLYSEKIKVPVPPAKVQEIRKEMDKLFQLPSSTVEETTAKIEAIAKKIEDFNRRLKRNQKGSVLSNELDKGVSTLTDVNNGLISDRDKSIAKQEAEAERERLANEKKVIQEEARAERERIAQEKTQARIEAQDSKNRERENIAKSNINTNSLLSMPAGNVEEARAKVNALNAQMDKLVGLKQKLDNDPTNKFLQQEYKNAQKLTVEIERLNKELQGTKYLSNIQLKSGLDINNKPIDVKNVGLLQSYQTELSKRMQGGNIYSKDYIELAAAKQRMTSYERIATGQMDAYNTKLEEQINTVKRGHKVHSEFINLLKSYVSVYAIRDIGREIVSITSQFDMQKRALGALIGDQSKAVSIFSQIKANALQSPFSTLDITGQAKQLAAFGVQTKDLVNTTKMLGDIAAGTGADMSRLILAFGQVKSAEFLRGQEARQFSEAGVPLIDALSQKYSKLEGHLVSMGDVYKRISERGVSFKDVAEALQNMTEKGGRFYNMQGVIAETTYGRMENLHDAMQQSFDKLGRSSSGWINTVLTGLTNIAKNLNIYLNLIGKFALFGGLPLFLAKKSNSNISRQYDKTFDTVALRAEQARSFGASANYFEQQSKNPDLKRGERDNLEKQAKSYRDAEIYSRNLYNKETERLKILKANTEELRNAKVQYHNANGLVAKGNALLNITKVSLKNIGRSISNFVSSNWITLLLSGLTVVIGKIKSITDRYDDLDTQLADISKAANEKAAEVNKELPDLVKNVLKYTDGSVEQEKAMTKLSEIYGEILPAEQLEIKHLRDLKGHYDELTKSAKEYIEVKASEDKKNIVKDAFTEGMMEQIRQHIQESSIGGIFGADKITKAEMEAYFGDTVRKGHAAGKGDVEILKECSAINDKLGKPFRIDFGPANLGFLTPILDPVRYWNFIDEGDGLDYATKNQEYKKNAEKENLQKTLTRYGSTYEYQKKEEHNSNEISSDIFAKKTMFNVNEYKKLVDLDSKRLDNFKSIKAYHAAINGQIDTLVYRTKNLVGEDKARLLNHDAMFKILRGEAKTTDYVKGASQGQLNAMSDMIKYANDQIGLGNIINKQNWDLLDVLGKQTDELDLFRKIMYDITKTPYDQMVENTLEIEKSKGRLKNTIDTDQKGKGLTKEDKAAKEYAKKAVKAIEANDQKELDYLANDIRIKYRSINNTLLGDTLTDIDTVRASMNKKYIYTKPTDKKGGGTHTQFEDIYRDFFNPIFEAKKRYDELLKNMLPNDALNQVTKEYTKAFDLMKGKFKEFVGKDLTMDIVKQENFKTLLDAIDTVVGKIQAKYISAKKGVEKRAYADDIMQLSKIRIDLQQEQLDKEIDNTIKKINYAIDNNKNKIDIYEKIFSETGSDKIASEIANNLYGDKGINTLTLAKDEFKKRIDETLNNLNTADTAEGIINMVKSVKEQVINGTNWTAIDEIIGKMPNGKVTDALKELVSVVKKAQEDIMANAFKGLKKYQSISEEYAMIIREYKKQLSDNSALSGDTKDLADKLALEKQQQRLAENNLKWIKSSNIYLNTLNNLSNSGRQSLIILKEYLQEFLNTSAKGLDPTEIKSLTNDIKKIDDVLKPIKYTWKDFWGGVDVETERKVLENIKEIELEILKTRELIKSNPNNTDYTNTLNTLQENLDKQQENLRKIENKPFAAFDQLKESGLTKYDEIYQAGGQITNYAGAILNLAAAYESLINKKKVYNDLTDEETYRFQKVGIVIKTTAGILSTYAKAVDGYKKIMEAQNKANEFNRQNANSKENKKQNIEDYKKINMLDNITKNQVEAIIKNTEALNKVHRSIDDFKKPTPTGVTTTTDTSIPNTTDNNTKQSDKKDDKKKTDIKIPDKKKSDYMTSIGDPVGDVSNLVEGKTNGGQFLSNVGNGMMSGSGGNPYVLIAGAIVSVIGQVINGVIEIQNLGIDKKIETIKKQTKELDYNIKSIENSMKKTAGNDYFSKMRQKLEDLRKQSELAQQQLELEKKKTKADDKEIQSYEDAYKESSQKIIEYQQEMFESLMGSDITSYLNNIVNVFVQAREAGQNTFKALKKSFAEMVSNMIQKSIMADVIKKHFQSVFDTITDMTEKGGMSTADVKRLVAQGIGATQRANNALRALYPVIQGMNNAFSVTSSTAGGLTAGIKGMTEETAGTLTGVMMANLNHVSGIDTNIMAIRRLIEDNSSVSGVIQRAKNSEPIAIQIMSEYQERALQNLVAIEANTRNTVARLDGISDKVDNLSNVVTSMRGVNMNATDGVIYGMKTIQ